MTFGRLRGNEWIECRKTPCCTSWHCRFLCEKIHHLERVILQVGNWHSGYLVVLGVSCHSANDLRYLNAIQIANSNIHPFIANLSSSFCTACNGGWCAWTVGIQKHLVACLSTVELVIGSSGTVRWNDFVGKSGDPMQYSLCNIIGYYSNRII